MPFARTLPTKILGAIALSYCADTLLLIGFTWSGTVRGWVPLSYAALGLTNCVVIYWLLQTPLTLRWQDEHLAPLQLAMACAVQLLFVALVPQLGCYFTAVLFIVFAFASLRLRIREVAAAWAVVAGVLGGLAARNPDLFVAPHATGPQRALVGAGILFALARCILIGVFSSHLRGIVGSRYQVIKITARASEAELGRTSTMLHEDVAQDLTGISLAVAACASRLRQRNEPVAAELELANAQLRTAIQKTRLIATSNLPAQR